MLLILLVVTAFEVVGCAGSGSESTTEASSPTAATTSSVQADAPPPVPKHLQVKRLPQGLPLALSGEALTASQRGLLVIGGLDQTGVSTDGVYELDPKTGKTTEAGSLANPLHDLAAATVSGGTTLAFGGGSATTVSSVQEIVTGGTSRLVGQLPSPASDLSALAVGPRAYVVAGYDGTEALGDVLATEDGSKFHRVAVLSVPVRYTALVELGGTLFAFGGEKSDGTDSRAIQAVDLKSGRARIVGNLPTTLAHASAVVLGGGIFVLGGREDGSAGRDILAFDPATGKVSAGGRLPAPLTNSAAATFAHSGYLVGGLDANTAAVASVEKLTPRP